MSSSLELWRQSELSSRAKLSQPKLSRPKQLSEPELSESGQ